MAPCQPPSQLPDNLSDLPVPDAVRDVLRAHFDDVAALKDCTRKHKELSDWIKAE
jgi:hypothetical protein